MKADDEAIALLVANGNGAGIMLAVLLGPAAADASGVL